MEGVSLNSGSDFARLFMLFLIAVSVITVVRAAWLSWRLFSPFGRPRVSIDQCLDQAVSADRLAESALAGRLTMPAAAAAAAARSAEIDRAEALRIMRVADARFRYLWRLVEARVIATRGLARLTLLASAFTTIATAYSTFEWELGTGIYGIAALYTAGKVLGNRLAVGLLVCLALWAVALFFHGRIHRRMASWRYFHAIARAAMSAGAPRGDASIAP